MNKPKRRAGLASRCDLTLDLKTILMILSVEASKNTAYNKIFVRRLAQLVERHPYKVDVVGSIPAPPTKKSVHKMIVFFYVQEPAKQ